MYTFHLTRYIFFLQMNMDGHLLKEVSQLLKFNKTELKNQ
jgi:hypothetical protein